MMINSFCIWLTGISGAGKTTIAHSLKQHISKQLNLPICILDGDEIRKSLSKDLKYSLADRKENIRRVAEVSKILVNNGIITIVAMISPIRSSREDAKKLFKKNQFFEIFIDTPLEIAEKRDSKGLYQAARKGIINQFTGISSIYEPPLTPDYTIDTLKTSPAESSRLIFEMIRHCAKSSVIVSIQS